MPQKIMGESRLVKGGMPNGRRPQYAGINDKATLAGGLQLEPGTSGALGGSLGLDGFLLPFQIALATSPFLNFV